MKARNRCLKLLSCLGLAAMLLNPAAFADDAQLMNIVRQLQNQMAEMQKTMAWQSEKIRTLEMKSGESIASTEPAGDFRGVFAEGLKEEIGKDYEWLKDLKFKGDLRLRYEAQQETGSGAAADRNRFRYRLRYGFEKGLKGPFEGDKMTLGFRMVSATGENVAAARNSTNTTFDNQFAYKDIALDQAWAAYSPGVFNRGSLETEITAGKFSNPFEEGSTWIMWDSDVTPEGLYEKFGYQLTDSESFESEANLILGQFILDESGSSDNNDSEVWAYQLNLGSEIDVGMDKPLKTKHAVSYYDFRDFVNGNFGAAGNNFVSAGRLAAEDFYVLDFYNEIGMDIPGVAPFKVYFDWVKNLGEDAAGKATGGGQDKAWMLGAKLGSAKKKGQWELKYEYAWIEANAVPGVFTDSDFGGTDRRGSVIKAGYALSDNLAVNGALFLTNRILTGNPSISDRERDLMQIDLVWKV